MSNDIVAVEVQTRRLGNMNDRTYNSRWRASRFEKGDTFCVAPSTVFFTSLEGKSVDFQYDWYEYRYRGLVRSTNLWTYVPVIEPSGEVLEKYIARHRAEMVTP